MNDARTPPMLATRMLSPAACAAAALTLAALGAGAVLGLDGPPKAAAVELKDRGDGLVAKYVHREGDAPLTTLWNRELQAAKAASEQVIVVFTADWCTPCRTLKVLLETSDAVRAGAEGGRWLFIDVDEWRGPAHRLIPGVVPRKLPTIVRVDDEGQSVVETRGSKLGLLSAEATAANLSRLVKGLEPEEPGYRGDKDKERELRLAENKRLEEVTKGVPRAEMTVVHGASSAYAGVWTVDLTLRNHDARKRWFVLPLSVGTGLEKKGLADGWASRRFKGHARAGYFMYEAGATFAVIAVAGHGTAKLEGWLVAGPSGMEALEIWELDRMKVGDNVLQFDRKTPYALRVQDAWDTATIDAPSASDTAEPETLALELRVARTHSMPLQ